MILDSLSAADRMQLHELYARSVMLLELRRCQDWVDLFEPGAFFQCRTTATRAEFKGRADLLRLAQQISSGEFDLALGKIQPGSHSRHILHNICLFQEGLHQASGYAHVSVMSLDHIEPPHFLASGLYTDRLSKCGSGCWRFASRRFTLDGRSESHTDAKMTQSGVLPTFPSH